MEYWLIDSQRNLHAYHEVTVFFPVPLTANTRQCVLLTRHVNCSAMKSRYPLRNRELKAVFDSKIAL